MIAAQAKNKSIKGKYKLTLLAVRPDKRKRDLDNLIKAASDALVTAKVIEDHNCDWLEIRWVTDGPECVVILEELPD